MTIEACPSCFETISSANTIHDEMARKGMPESMEAAALDSGGGTRPSHGDGLIASAARCAVAGQHQTAFDVSQSFIFQQTTPGLIGAVTINHFNPAKDVITLSSQLTTTVSYQDNSQGKRLQK
jgi:hypothetical protein